MNKENVNKFRELFVEFEKLTKKKLNTNKIDTRDAIDKLKNNRITPYYKEYEFMHFCRDCRNRISHVNDDYKYIIYTDEFITKLERIIDQIKNPPTVYEMSTHPVVSAYSTDYVKKIMNEMIDKNYTHIPIYDNEKLIGIFSEGCIFNYLMNNDNIDISNNTKFEDIKECISITNSKELVKFVSKNKLYDKIVNEFIENYKFGNRLSCVMVTENGKCFEKIEGIITAWDIIGRD